MVRADPRRVPPPDGQRPPRRADGRAPRPRHRVRGRRRARAHRPGRRAWPAGCRPATCTSTASSATSARACCATAGCWPARASSWSSSPSTRQTGKVLVGPEIITRGWVYAPEAEDLLDEACDTIAAAVEKALADGRARRRGARARRAPGRRQVRQRAHPPPPDDRARRDGGVSAGRRRVGAARRRRCGRVGARACGGRRRRGAVRPLLDQIAPAIAAVEAELGGPQQYFEINSVRRHRSVRCADAGRSTLGWTGLRRGLVLALTLSACGGDGDDNVTPVLDQIAPAVAAIEAELGGPQQYFEINATPQLVNLFVAIDGATRVAPYVYVGGELAPGGRSGRRRRSDVRQPTSLSFDPDAVLDAVGAELPDADVELVLHRRRTRCSTAPASSPTTVAPSRSSSPPTAAVLVRSDAGLGHPLGTVKSAMTTWGPSKRRQPRAGAPSPAKPGSRAPTRLRRPPAPVDGPSSTSSSASG